LGAGFAEAGGAGFEEAVVAGAGFAALGATFGATFGAAFGAAFWAGRRPPFVAAGFSAGREALRSRGAGRLGAESSRYGLSLPVSVDRVKLSSVR
jgi:hypothetical protein